jgi:hypothetical protein
MREQWRAWQGPIACECVGWSIGERQRRSNEILTVSERRMLVDSSLQKRIEKGKERSLLKRYHLERSVGMQGASVNRFDVNKLEDNVLRDTMRGRRER